MYYILYLGGWEPFDMWAVGRGGGEPVQGGFWQPPFPPRILRGCSIKDYCVVVGIRMVMDSDQSEIQSGQFEKTGF